MSCREIFSKNLKIYMLQNNKNQNDIIRDLKVTSSVISSWCTGKAFPRVEKLEMLAEYLNIDVVDFFIEDRTDTKLIMSIINQLDDEYRVVISEQAKALLNLQKNR